MERLRRREFLALVASAGAWSIAARAQQPPKVRRVGVLSQDPISAQLTPPYQAFQRSLRELGWVEGQNLALEWRFSEGNADLLPRLAAALVALPVDLIVAIATPPALAAAAAT